MAEFEYTTEDTWHYWPAPSKPEWFEKELTELGGKNRFGQPNLKLVWGGDEMNDHTETRQLKYLAGFSRPKVHGYKYQKDGETHFTENIDDLDASIMVLPDIRQEPLGLPRWIIEQWIAPEELEKQGRFRRRYAEGDLDPTLREFPREGIYDTFFIVQNAQGMFRPVDKDVLEHLKWQLWYNKKSFEEKEKDKVAMEMEAARQRSKKMDEIQEAAMNLELRLPKELKEEREEYWAKKKNYEQEEKIAQATGHWYVPDSYEHQ